jgi:hypothetical protein
MSQLSARETRFYHAYLRMAEEARYRPQAPSDGCGNIQLAQDEFEEPDRLHQEAVAYALGFAREEDGLTFDIGCSDFQTNRAFVWTIEAARLLCGGAESNAFALKLLEMAAREVKAATLTAAANPPPAFADQQ